MKINKKDNKKLIVSLVVIIVLIIVGFLFIQKFQNDKIKANNQNKNAVETEEVDKNSGTTSKENPTTGTTSTDGSVNDKTSTGSENISAEEKAKVAQQQKAAEQIKVESTKQGITVFVKAANFGSIVDISIDSSKFDSSYKNYQFFIGSSAISKVEAVTKIQTNMFPAQEAGTEVTINLMDNNKKVIKKLNVILNAK